MKGLGARISLRKAEFAAYPSIKLGIRRKRWIFGQPQKSRHAAGAHTGADGFHHID